MPTSMAIKEIYHSTIRNRKYVKKTKISHNSENLKPSQNTVHFFPFLLEGNPMPDLAVEYFSSVLQLMGEMTAQLLSNFLKLKHQIDFYDLKVFI